MQFTLVGTEDGSNISVFIPGREPLVAHSSHPNFEDIVEGVMAGDESVVKLFDLALTAETNFKRLSERVSVANGRLYFDGDEVDNSLAKQVVRFINEGVEDWRPLVLFFENVQNNSNDHSRTQLFDWLERQDFTITSEGLIVGYKGVEKLDDGTFLSIHGGRATVDGVVHEGRIPQSVGSIVEMPRGDVHHDPSSACSTGLHAASFDFAQGFNKGAMLELHINPRDVVSVPSDSGGQKMRVCRYVVVGELDAPHSSALVSTHDPYDDEEEVWCEYCASIYCEIDDPNCDVCHELTGDEDWQNDDDPLHETASEFYGRCVGSVDSAWKAWNTDPDRDPMTRDEFRAAVRDGV